MQGVIVVSSGRVEHDLYRVPGGALSRARGEGLAMVLDFFGSVQLVNQDGRPAQPCRSPRPPVHRPLLQSPASSVAPPATAAAGQRRRAAPGRAVDVEARRQLAAETAKNRRPKHQLASFIGSSTDALDAAALRPLDERLARWPELG
ncbi:MAG: hypothetical protein ABW005_05570 [Burkholderiaceae bacterium]